MKPYPPFLNVIAESPKAGTEFGHLLVQTSPLNVYHGRDAAHWLQFGSEVISLKTLRLHQPVQNPISDNSNIL